jgi:hypothetical protein
MRSALSPPHGTPTETMDERRALLGDSNRNRLLQRGEQSYLLPDLYKSVSEQDGGSFYNDDDSCIIRQPTKKILASSSKAVRLVLAVVGTVTLSSLLLFHCHTVLNVKSRNNPVTTTSTLRPVLHTAVDAQPDTSMPPVWETDQIASLPPPPSLLDDKTLERWGDWKEPAEQTYRGSMWKDSAPALHHVWQTIRVTREQKVIEQQQGKRKLKKSTSSEDEGAESVVKPSSASSVTSTDEDNDPTALKEKSSKHVLSQPTTVAPSMAPRTDSSSFVEKLKSNVATVTEEVKDEAGNVAENVKNGAGSVANSLENDEQVAATWVKGTWDKTSQSAENMWNATINEEQTIVENLKGIRSNNSTDGDNSTTWIDAEKEWTQTFADRLRHLGGRIRSWWPKAERYTERESEQVADWWNNTEHSLSEDERVVQSKFIKWWDQASTEEKVWWEETTREFRNYTKDAEDEEELWWMITRDAAKRDWKFLQNKEDQAWKKSVQWEQNVANETSTIGHEAWDASSNSAVGAWEWTVDEEQKIWHAVQNWYKAHATYEEELATPLLYFNSTPAFSLLTNSYGWFDFSQDFFHLQSGWDTQMNQAYCPVATVAAVLNSFPRNEVSLPIDSDFSPHPYATQPSLLQNACVRNTVVNYNRTYDGIFHAPGGMSLDQTQDLLKCHLDEESFDIQTVHIDPSAISLDEFRGELILALVDSNARVLVNFNRQVLDQEGTGHFSPIGAYAKNEDAFLVMDVAKYKYPPAWVPAARLYASLATLDKCGDWDYPAAQNLITADEEKEAFQNKTVYKEILKKLNCKPTYRGYIIVKHKGR